MLTASCRWRSFGSIARCRNRDTCIPQKKGPHRKTGGNRTGRALAREGGSEREPGGCKLQYANVRCSQRRHRIGNGPKTDNTLLSRRQQSLTRRCQANTIERRAFDDQPTLSDRPIHCSLRRSFVDLQTAGDLMQHDWLQGPAIDGRTAQPPRRFDGQGLHCIAWPPTHWRGNGKRQVEAGRRHPGSKG
jgi:hypothetical protein